MSRKRKFHYLLPFLFSALLLIFPGCSSRRGLRKSKTAFELPEEYNTPDGMVADSEGNIYLNCPNWNDAGFPAKLLKISPDDTITEVLTYPADPMTKKANPLGIDIGADGNLYVADNQNPYIKEGKSRLLRVLMRNGSAVGCEVVAEGFNISNGVACTDKYVYLTETSLDADARPMPSGVYRFRYSEFNNGSVKIAPGGEDRHLIAKMYTDNPDALFGANGIDTDRQGNLFVGNFGRAELVRITIDKKGQVTGQEVFARGGGIKSIDGLKFDDLSQDIYIADFAGNAVHKVDGRSGEVTTLAKNGNTTGEGGLLDRPSEVCIRRDKIYVSNIDLPDNKNEYDKPHTISVIEIRR